MKKAFAYVIITFSAAYLVGKFTYEMIHPVGVGLELENGVFLDDCELSKHNFWLEYEKLKTQFGKDQISKVELAISLNNLVSKRFLHIHYKDKKKQFESNQVISFWRNWILYFTQQFSHTDDFYLIDNTKLAIERGIGPCAQQAHTLTSMLNDLGVEELYTLGLNGHVVCYLEGGATRA